MSVSNADVRKARAFLYSHEIPSRVISPRRFAAARDELGKSFAVVLDLIMRLRAGGQGQGQAPVAERIAMKRAA